jgi:hypothetical protein
MATGAVIAAAVPDQRCTNQIASSGTNPSLTKPIHPK